ncbi:hypothetical protein [Mesoplasma melaleucae]|uniref:Uncharacterized protein n=1 Tax=Mesoplasma melaleucae TaxID=81459 RepID=A0A2K8NY83_9MOLU|nr:hypothetical protein [Mesoplasma melaleucae]ATZ17603.1 hypothetical protein EMELA_v1c00080 [Mesoplasma melaleucae]
MSGIAKATILINAVSFIPSLIASGTLVVESNLFGQNIQKKLSSVVTTGIIVNFFITLFVFIILQVFAKDF